MSSKPLDNLVRTGQLDIEPSDLDETNRLIESGGFRLLDSQRENLTLDSRFDLAYNAVHALSLAALRRQGYRAKKRYMVFQCLAHTSSLKPEQWRVLADAHNKRNSSEYEGSYIPDSEMVRSVVRVGLELQTELTSS